MEHGAHADRAWFRALPAAAAALLSLVLAPAAGGAPVIVDVAPGSSPEAVAARHGVVPDHIFNEVANGFAADVTSKQLASLEKDRSVRAVLSDGVAGRIEHGPIRLLGRRSDPGAPPSALPGQPRQFVTAAIRRIGVPASSTADVDGVDDRRVDADIAILDGGVDPYHPDLNVVGGFDCLPGPRAQRGYYDRDGHGTLVAGFAAAIDNDIGLVGSAPGARIWAVRVADPNGFLTESALMCGLEFVARNRAVDVANLSFGGFNGMEPCRPGRGQASSAQRDRIHERICRLTDRGITVVAAAGNEASDASTVTPAAYPEVITVSAFADFDGLPGGRAATPNVCPPTERDDYLATFSNFGAPVDISAPGVCVTSTFPGGQYATAEGTSFAAPFVAGAAALIRARGPLSPEQVRARLLEAAEPGPIPGDPDGYPEGRLDVSTL